MAYRLLFIFLFLTTQSFAVLWGTGAECTPKKDRVADLKKTYGDVFVGGDEATRTAAWNHLSTLPDAYLDHAFKKQALKITLLSETTKDKDVPSGVRGVTTFLRDKPIRMKLRPPKFTGSANHFGLVHEMGHVVDMHLLYSDRNYEKAIDGLFAKDVKNVPPSRRSVWYLAATQEAEYAAELFDSYYCSPATRKRLKEKHTEAYRVAEKYYLEPIVK